MKKFSPINEYEWLGNFWFSDNPDSKFPGILSYSPKNGLVLSKDNNKSVTIYGYTQETGQVSLVSCCFAGNFSTNFTTQKEKYFCTAMIVGGYSEADVPRFN